jgi:hypothetical protein
MRRSPDERAAVLLRDPPTARSPFATFGRELDGHVDAVIGYELDHLTITNPQVIATSGSDRHPILRPTDRTRTWTGRFHSHRSRIGRRRRSRGR